MDKTVIMTSNLNTSFLSVPESVEKKQGPLTGKKIVIIISERLFHDREFTELKRIIEYAGAEMTIASSTLLEATGMLGLRVKPDILISEILVKNFNAVVFAGGVGCLRYTSDRQAHLIAKLVLKQGKILGAIGLAPRILADAGLLKAKKTNGFNPYIVTMNGATVTSNEVKRFGNIIIAIDSGSATKFGEAIVFSLSK